MSPTQATPPASRRPLILIVDDMPDIREMYAEYQASQGFRPEQAGCDGFLTKPCYPDALADEIRRVLRGWRRSH